VTAARAYVALGSNLGDRKARLEEAVDRLRRCDGVSVVRVSSFVETDPVGGPPGQGKYLNAVVSLDTTRTPQELLRACAEVERAMGRTRAARWGPRTIDVDILLYGDRVVGEPGLEIPHPRMHERRFVLAPLVEIDPAARHPGLGKTAAELLAALDAPAVAARSR